ncbi:hypothetical protein DFQ26_005913 [Actinomortierella ambigua]|nr:hypothetical protein DFQ26_005913 [Actinomortierella ambigua]
MNPLDIAELRLYVASYLGFEDVKTCALVCRSWYWYFQPLVWHTFTTPSHMDADDTTRQVALKDSIQNNAHWIRHFHVTGGIGVLHSLPDTWLERCKSLLTIRFDVYHRDDLQRWNRLIKSNSELRKIGLPSGLDRIVNDPHVLAILKSHSQLRELRLSSPFSISYLTRILQASPRLLKLFGVHLTDELDKPSDAHVQAEGSTTATTRTTTEMASTTCVLQHLDLARLDGRPALNHLIACTRHLETLSFQDSIGACRSSLIRLFQEGRLRHLVNLSLDKEDDYINLINAIPDGQLRMLKVRTSSILCLSAILQRHGPTLETLLLPGMHGCPELAQVMYRCPRLKVFGSGQGVHDDTHADVRAFLYGPWVCRSLEVLSVPIGLFRGNFTSTPPILDDALAMIQIRPKRQFEPAVAELLFMERLRQLEKLWFVDFVVQEEEIALSYTSQVEVLTNYNGRGLQRDRLDPFSSF